MINYGILRSDGTILTISEICKYNAETDAGNLEKYGVKIESFKPFDLDNICTWEYFEGENHTSCGKIFEFAGSNRNQLEFMYCPFCGGKIKDLR